MVCWDLIILGAHMPPFASYLSALWVAMTKFIQCFSHVQGFSRGVKGRRSLVSATFSSKGIEASHDHIGCAVMPDLPP